MSGPSGVVPNVACPICGMPDTAKQHFRDCPVSLDGDYGWVEADTLLEANFGLAFFQWADAKPNVTHLKFYVHDE